MSLVDMLKDLSYPGEVFTLQYEGYPTTPERDGFGDVKKTWVTLATMTGLIQDSSKLREIPRGKEEVPDYLGIFVSDFIIPTDKSFKYRIKHEIPESETRYYKILKIDRDLRLDKERHHYEFELGVERKWQE